MKDIGELGATGNSAPTVAAGDGPPWFAVTRDQYPTLYGVLDSFSDRAGFGQGHSGYALVLSWEPRLPAIEAALSGLDATEMDALRLGSVESRQNLAAGSEGLAETHRLLTEFTSEE